MIRKLIVMITLLSSTQLSYAQIVAPPTPLSTSVNTSLDITTLNAQSDHTPQFAIADQPGAVNFPLSSGSMTGFPVSLVALGTDTNIGLNLVAKGTQSIGFGNGSGQLAAIIDPGTGYGATAWPALQPSTSTSAPQVYITGASDNYSNVAVSLVGLGTYGAGLGPGHTISNTGAWAAGRFGQATGYSCGATGNSTYCSGQYSFGSGQYGTDNGVSGKRFHQSVWFNGTHGTAEIAELAPAAIATGTTAAVVTTTGSATASATNSLILLNNAVVSYRILVVVTDTTTTTNRAYWDITAGFFRGSNAAATVLDWSAGTGSPSHSTGTGSGWTIGVSANTTIGGGVITFTGTGTDTYRVVARVVSAEVAGG